MPLHLLLLPLTAALVGWLTNVAAVRLLFRPIHPVRIPWTPWSVQGVFPRRQETIAESIGRLVEEKFLRPQDLLASLDGSFQQEAVAELERYVADRLKSSLPSFLPAGVRTAVTTYVVDRVRREAAGAVESVVGRLEERVVSDVRVGRLISERISRLDLADFEESVVRLIGAELRWLEALGAVMGFAIGLVQMLIAWL